jgi:hypothetical protein
MRRSLTAHPDFPPNPVFGIEVEVERVVDVLTLRYVLTGDLARIAVSPPAASTRTDELWRHTCFEAFVQPEGGEGYLEFNFAPSTQWAAYRFSGYREGMAPAEMTPPRIETIATATALDLTVRLALPPGPCRLALSAVIETIDGAKSYWALAHPPGRPDFHHRSSFACSLTEAA